MSSSAPSRSRLRLPALYALVVLAIFALTRVGLALWTGLDAVPLADWPAIFAKGLWFDLAVLAALLAPVWLYEALLPDRVRATRIHRGLRFAWFALAVFALLFVALAEATFWLEFATRFNFIAVDYLVYTREVIGNVRESYPVGWIVAAIALAAIAIATLLRPALARADVLPITRRRRVGYALAAVAVPAAVLTAASVDQMGGIGNAYADELSGNGIFTFVAAFRRNELDYDRFYATIDQDRADHILKSLGVERKPLARDSDIARREHEDDEEHLPITPATPRHVVMAPVPGQAIVRRPGNDHLATIGEILEHQGFATSFVYGGYGYFDNMNAYFDANDYRVVDRTEFPKSSVVFENVWGVADEALFGNALTVIEANVAQGKRTFTHIMTTSNHRPFTYPDGRIDIKSPGGREGAVKYTDWAIGRFVEEARRRPWFDDTLFVFLADHCAAVAGKSKLPVAGYRIPLILYAPKLVKPGVYEPVASQIDLPPTLLDVLRVDGDDHFFGRSVFELPAAPARAFKQGALKAPGYAPH